MLTMMSCCLHSLRRLSTRKLLVSTSSTDTFVLSNNVNLSALQPRSKEWRSSRCPALQLRSKEWMLGHELCTRASSVHEQGDTLHSPSSTYFSVHIHCSKHVAEIFSEALLCFGASSTSMDELSSSEDIDMVKAPLEILRTVSYRTSSSLTVGISSIFTNDQDVHSCLSSAANSIGLKRTPSYEITIGKQCEWIKNMQETFHPIEVTDGLWIVPEWDTPPNIQATNIILDPGMAFGTGEHPTTKLCLLLLNGLIKGGECFLDYGTGSGVLGIAAVKMGAAMSVGVDIDPQAILSASQNIALNEIEPDKMLLYLAPNDITSISWDGKSYDNLKEQTSYTLAMDARKEKFDIVIANILLNPLLELVEDIVTFGRPGAVIGVSGILSEQTFQIKERYSNYLDDISVSELDGWACVSGTRKFLTNF